jgi:hypothetical protein
MRSSAIMASPSTFAGTCPGYGSNFSIGGVSVGIEGDRSADVALVSPLALFRSEAGLSHINIRVAWAEDLLPVSRRQLFDSGATWRLYEDDGGFQFDFSAPFYGEQPYRRLFVDSQFRRATLQLNGGCRARSSYPGVALSYPLDELLIMHRLTQEKAIELHSCGIVRPDGTGNLFVGHSGAGKSTTTRLWTEREDVEILSDDRIIVRRDEDKSEVVTPCAQGDKKKGMRMYGTPWHGEAMYASPGSAPLTRIFILEHGHGNVLTRLSPSHAVAELFARSFVPFHRHEYVDAALDFLQELVGSVPCYHYSFEPDQRAVDTILNFHD